MLLLLVLFFLRRDILVGLPPTDDAIKISLAFVEANRGDRLNETELLL